MGRVSIKKLDRENHARTEASPQAGVATSGRADNFLNTVVPQPDVDGYVREIERLWGQVREKFLAIGEYLLVAKECLPHGQYEDMLRARLPFDPSIARKMRAVAEAVRGGRLSRPAIPNSYATAYEVTLLTDDALAAAKARNLLRPDVRRREIVALRAEFDPRSHEERTAALRREYEALRRDADRIRTRAQEILTELGDAADGLAGIELSGISARVRPGVLEAAD